MKKIIALFTIAILALGASAQSPFDVQKVNVTQSVPNSKSDDDEPAPKVRKYSKKQTGKNAKIQKLPNSSPSLNTSDTPDSSNSSNKSNSSNSSKPSNNGIVSRSKDAKDPLYYKITNDKESEVAVTKLVRSNNLKGRIIIPETVIIKNKKYKVVRIDAMAFAECTTITQVDVMGNMLVSIGDNAFRNCTSLQGVSLNNKCTKIARNCFNGCKKTITLTTSHNVKKDYFQNTNIVIRKR